MDTILYKNFHKLFRHSDIILNAVPIDSTEKFIDNFNLISKEIQTIKEINVRDNITSIKKVIPTFFSKKNNKTNDEVIINILEELIIYISNSINSEYIIKEIIKAIEEINKLQNITSNLSKIKLQIINNLEDIKKSNNLLYFKSDIITYNEYAIYIINESLSLFTNIHLEKKDFFNKNINILEKIFSKFKDNLLLSNEKIDIPIKEELPILKDPILKDPILKEPIYTKLKNTTDSLNEMGQLLLTIHAPSEPRGGNINNKLDYMKEQIRYKISLIKPNYI